MMIVRQDSDEFIRQPAASATGAKRMDFDDASSDDEFWMGGDQKAQEVKEVI